MSRPRSASPPSKRVKIDTASPKAPELGFTNADTPLDSPANLDSADEESDYEFNCSICLQNIADRTVLPKCSHEFCFECIIVWSEQSRRCPLCSSSLGEYLIHNIRSKYDFRKHHLAPLRTPSESAAASAEIVRQRRTARGRERERRLKKEREEKDRLTRSIEKRRWVYEHDLYAKHVASNSYTRYRPSPTPAQFAASQELVSRTIMFLRRELQVWDDLDVEFLTTFIVSMMKSIDIRSESAVKLLAEFLDMDAPYIEGGRHNNAEHFAHEVYSYVRSPFRDIFVYDSVVQYDISHPPENHRGRVSWSRSCSRSRSRRRSRRRSSSRRAESESSGGALSWSPSGRQYPGPRNERADSHSSTSRCRHRSEERMDDYDFPGGPRHERVSFPCRTSCSVADAIYGTSRTKMIKGKERADAETLSDLPKSLDEANRLGSPPAEEIVSVATGSDQLKSNTSEGQTSTSQFRKPPRNRSLLESVHSHLALGNKEHVNTGRPQLEHRGRVLNRQRHYNKPPGTLLVAPTSLAQLSSPTTPAGRDERGPELEMLTSSESTANRHQVLPAIGDREGSELTRINAPESTARPHAPISKIDSSIILGSPSVTQPATRSTASLQQSLAKECDPLDTKPIEIIAGSDSSGTHLEYVIEFHQDSISGMADNLYDLRKPAGTNHMAMRGIPIYERPSISTQSSDKSHPSPSSSDTRTELLRRLQQEKRLARSDNTRRSELCHDRTFRMTNNDSQSSAITAERTIDTSEFDPLLVEAKLRKRAQLQIRLAAEKDATVCRFRAS